LPKQPRLTPQEADAILIKAGFVLVRSKGSHRIYIKGGKRIVIPFHVGRILHPKIVKQIMTAVETS